MKKQKNPIVLKTKQEIALMRKVGRLAGQLLEYLGSLVQPGISTLFLNQAAEDWIRERNTHGEPLKSAIFQYNGFPMSICTSVNHVVCHGIPKSDHILLSGDIINIDVTLLQNEFHGDTSKTFTVGKVKPSVEKLVKAAENSLYLGIDSLKVDKPINVIGDAIEKYIKSLGFSIVTELGGHGIGRGFHESPYIFHHRERKKRTKIQQGMTFTIEPMINAGKRHVYTDASDGWSVLTYDNSLSAQFEHTIAITEDGPEILTNP